jgi:hypothetical protein
MIQDNNTDLVTSTPAIRIAPGGFKEFHYPIQCKTGYEIAAVPDDDVSIFAKANPGDAYQNISISPLDLGSYAPNVQTIYFKIAIDAGADDGDRLSSVFVRFAS